MDLVYKNTQFRNDSDLLGHLVYVSTVLYLLYEHTQGVLKIW